MTAFRSLLLVLLAAAASAWGVPVEKWVQTTRADFQNGKAQNTAVLALGQVTLAPELKSLLDKPVPHLWALAAGPRGIVYAAAGIPAQLLRVQGDKTDVFFTAPIKTDLELLSVAVGPDGAIYAAAAPSGTLYRIAPDGTAKELYKSPDPYIWSLAVARDNTVYCATGPNGRLVKVDPKGKATTLLKSKAKHILCVFREPDGTLYAGTDAYGFLYRIAVKGDRTPRIVYDASESDIRAVARDPKGNLYVATAATATATTTTSTTSKTITRRPSGLTIVRPSTPAKPSAPGATLKATNSIYRVAPDGTVTRVVAQKGVAFYGLAWHQGHLLASTGNAGKLYRVEDHHLVQLADLPESQIMALGVAGKQLVLATANPGRIYRVAADHAASGTLLSEVYDTTSLSRFGQIEWEAVLPKGASITLQTRTGNTDEPDASWRPWSRAYSRSSGQPVDSPPARFIQYRATLKRAADGAAPVLDEVVIAYVRANEAPRITGVKIGKPPVRRPPTTSSRIIPGTAKSTPTPTRSVNTRKQAAGSQRGPFAGRIRVTWTATDPNKDSLFFALYFRGEDETTWKKIRDKLTINYYDWDTETVPDGPCRFRIVASDARSNPAARALQGDIVTEAFLIDNTPPTVAKPATKTAADRVVTVTVKATDTTSRIASAEYTVDGGDWTQVGCVDGIFDGAAETITFSTKALAAGEHTIVVRARDDAGNSGAAKAVLRVK